MRHLLVLFVLSTSACATYSTHVTPNPTPEGEFELGTNLDLLGLSRRGKSATLPNLEMTLRYGLSDSVDLGGKVNMMGAEFNAKASLYSGVVDIAFFPGAGLGIGALGNDDNRAFMTWFFTSMLFGLPLGDAIELVLALKPMVQAAAGSGIDGSELITGDLVVLPGGAFGIRFVLGQGISLFPELNVHLPYAVDKSRWLDPVWQGGVAFQVAVSL